MAPPTPIQSKLDTKLIYELRKSPLDAMQVVGFLMWIQSLLSTAGPDLLVGAVMDQPNLIIEFVADEILDTLRWVQCRIIPYTFGIYHMHYFEALMATAADKIVTKDHLYRHREIVIKGVREMISDFAGFSGDGDDDSAAPCSCGCRSDAGKEKVLLPLCAEVKESAPEPPNAEVETAAVKRARRKGKKDAGAGASP